MSERGNVPERIVIVGAGKGGAQLAASLRDAGSTARITLLGDEDAAPYERPPLSKGYLLDGPDGEKLDTYSAEFYAEHDIDLRVGSRVVAIEPAENHVTLEGGETVPYDRLVLATGADPRSLPIPGADLQGVVGLRSLADAAKLRELLRAGRELVVIGGGYLGLEVAVAAATGFDLPVTVIESLPRLLARTAVPGTAEYVAAYHTALGVRVLLSAQVIGLGADEGGHVAYVETDTGERLPAGVVFYGIGAIPRVELAVSAGLEVGNGIRVNASLKTSVPNIWAIGDCCEFPSAHVNASVRLESIQNAVDQARHLAAEFTGGDPGAYRATPWFWSDQSTMKIQSVGYVRDHDESVTIGSPAEGKFSVLVFQGGRLVGADSVNAPGHHLALRKLYTAGAVAALTPAIAREPGFAPHAFVKAVLAS